MTHTNEYIKLICNQGASNIEFTINPNIDMDEMVENMECFLKAIGYQFNHLNYTSHAFDITRHTMKTK